MKLVMRGMMSEMQPALDDGQGAGGGRRHLKELGPKLHQLIALIDDIKNYDAPIMLPNGDILIRRTAPLVPGPDVLPQPGPNGEIG